MPCNGYIQAVDANNGYIASSKDEHRFLTDLCCPPFVIQAQTKITYESCASCYFAKNGIFASTPDCLLYTTRIGTYNFSQCQPCDIRPFTCTKNECIEDNPNAIINCDPIPPPSVIFTTTLFEVPENVDPSDSEPCYPEGSLQPIWNSILTDGYTNCCPETSLNGWDYIVRPDGTITLFPFIVDCPTKIDYQYSGTPSECTLKVNEELTDQDWVNSLNGFANYTHAINGAVKFKQTCEFRIYHTRPPTCSGYLKIWTRIRKEQRILNKNISCIPLPSGVYTYSDYQEYEFSDINVNCSTDLSGTNYYTPIQILNPSVANGHGESLQLEWKFSLYEDCEPPWPENGQTWNGSYRTTANCMTSPDFR